MPRDETTGKYRLPGNGTTTMAIKIAFGALCIGGVAWLTVHYVPRDEFIQHEKDAKATFVRKDIYENDGDHIEERLQGVKETQAVLNNKLDTLARQNDENKKELLEAMRR